MTRKKNIIEKRSRKQPKRMWPAVFRWTLWGALLVVLTGTLSVAGILFYLSRDLPAISSLADYRPPIITSVYSDDGRKIAEFYKERRIVTPLDEIPELVKRAFIAAEDARFFAHKGIDLLGILRAFFKNIEAGEIVQGGSTITQQVTKSFLLTPERKYTRKVREAILAYRIEKRFSKDEILYLYLNQIYLGGGAYGVAAAAENYFNKSLKELDLAESALLAGLPQAPSRYSPFRYPERARQRQLYVLNRMVEQGDITSEQARAAFQKELHVQPRRNWYLESVPYYTEYVRQYVETRYGQDALYTGGLQIYCPVNIEMQEIAREVVDQGLRDLDKRQGFRGPIRHLAREEIAAFCEEGTQKETQLPVGKIAQGVVVAVDPARGTIEVQVGSERGVLDPGEMRWARKSHPKGTETGSTAGKLRVGDVIQVRKLPSDKDAGETVRYGLEQTPEVQAALVSMDAPSGEVKVMVGGRDFKESQFNRAVQSRRQPGSAFKPVIYAAALDKGYTPATLIVDAPLVFRGSGPNRTWKPKNYEGKFHGPTMLRKAFAKSLNLVTIRILENIGVDYAIGYARKLGITSDIDRNLSIALGSSGVSVLELTAAYAVFNNLGHYQPPIFIRKILDRDGREIEVNAPKKEKVMDAATAYLMTSLMESVVKEGTGQRVLALGRPVAGKTGTTNDLLDAWFIGFTPEYVTGTWVGFDDERSLGPGETGAKAASPIWLAYMKRVLEGRPITAFQVPEGVVFTRIDADTGLLASAGSERVVYECFKAGTAPTTYSRRPDAVIDREDFFKEGL